MHLTGRGRPRAAPARRATAGPAVATTRRRHCSAGHRAARSIAELVTLPLSRPWLALGPTRRRPRPAGAARTDGRRRQHRPRGLPAPAGLLHPGLAAGTQPRRPPRTSSRGWPRALRAGRATGGPVSLVGWSLGGSIAGSWPRDHPELVRQVITLGSPFALVDPRQSRADRTFTSATTCTRRRAGYPPGAMRQPIPVPSTPGVYSGSTASCPGGRAWSRPASGTRTSRSAAATRLRVDRRPCG